MSIQYNALVADVCVQYNIMQGFGAACFGADPAPAPGIFYPEPAPAPGKREHNFGIFKTDYELSKIRSNTCTSTYRS